MKALNELKLMLFDRHRALEVIKRVILFKNPCIAVQIMVEKTDLFDFKMALGSIIEFWQAKQIQPFRLLLKSFKQFVELWPHS